VFIVVFCSRASSKCTTNRRNKYKNSEMFVLETHQYKVSWKATVFKLLDPTKRHGNTEILYSVGSLNVI